MNHDYAETPDPDTESPTDLASSLNGGIDEISEKATNAYESTKTAVGDAYARTAGTLQSSYKRTLEYGAEHPERFGLATFAAGLGAGTLLVATAFAVGRRSRTERIAAPLIDVAAEVARAVLRR
jgi:hypothetical protein